MGDVAFNVSKAQVGYYAGLPASSDALVAVVLESSGLEDDATLAAYDTLGDLLGNNTEQTTMGRKTLASVTVTPGTTVDLDAADLTWTSASGSATGAIVIVYVPDTGTSVDADMIPLSKHDFVTTPSGSDIAAQIDNFIIVK